MIDLMESGAEGRTAGYLIEAEKLTLVETGPGPSGDLILHVLREKGYTLSDLRYIVVTHIHLDHAGAAGYLLSRCPQAMLVVHPSGARHMADPSRLIAGAKMAFDDFDARFQPVIPIPPERILSVAHEEALDLGNRKLIFYHGRGHANHHLTALDSLTQGLFSGDLLGIHVPEFAQYNIDYSLLSTAPSQFDPVSFTASLKKIEEINPRTIYFSHFGVVTGLAAKYIDTCRENLALFQQVTAEACSQGEATWQEIAGRLKIAVKDKLVKMGYPKEKPLPIFIEQNIDLDAKGLLDWVEKSQGK
ncbi:hypothetical protein DCMF_18775 [Candidatus Formimonas warabiya]|uniref:Metallo-beta-lactamase domain-containing protein n=2 Tax=Formimonas warabiya TaxID=1761012 RepID=A0A3G1L2P5_FORW1|nr:hypothetical protein DCMF_18775 [Candidatus Formimonas warabiya]